MKSISLILTVATLALAPFTDAQQFGVKNSHRSLAHGLSHRDPAEVDIRALSFENPVKKRIAKRCKAPSSTSSSAADLASTATVSSSTVSSSTVSSSAVISSTVSSSSAPSSSSIPTTSSSSSPPVLTASSGSGHTFTFVNQCSYTVQPAIGNTCGNYSPSPCSVASSYTGPAPGPLGAGQTTTVEIPDAWNGRVWNADSASCGDLGENCSMGEFNLDTGSQYTAQAYDLSNIQGFTQSMSIASGPGCTSVTCTSATCPCTDAYPVGDMTGCGNDLPVKACGPGNIPFTITFCP